MTVRYRCIQLEKFPAITGFEHRMKFEVSSLYTIEKVRIRSISINTIRLIVFVSRPFRESKKDLTWAGYTLAIIIENTFTSRNFDLNYVSFLFCKTTSIHRSIQKKVVDEN